MKINVIKRAEETKKKINPKYDITAGQLTTLAEHYPDLYSLLIATFNFGYYQGGRGLLNERRTVEQCTGLSRYKKEITQIIYKNKSGEALRQVMEAARLICRYYCSSDDNLSELEKNKVESIQSIMAIDKEADLSMVNAICACERRKSHEIQRVIDASN